MQAAITKVMNAQQSGRGDKTLQRAALKDLTERETILLNRYKAESGTGGIPRVNFGVLRRS